MKSRSTFPRQRVHWSQWLTIGLSLGFLLFLLPTGSFPHAQPIARAQQDDGAYDNEFQKGLDLLRLRNYEEALKSFKRANEMRGKKSAECFYGMAQAYFALEAYKSVAESCDKTIELAGSDDMLRAQAYNLQGLALRSQAETKDLKKLREAEALFLKGLALKVEHPILTYNLGVVLLQQSRDPEGIAELEKYLKLVPEGTFADQAQKLIDNPRRAREAFAPDFSMTTSAGEHITLEDLRGKVVVLDFWGTWCPPCIASVPSLRALNKKYSKEPSFVMIGISCKDQEETWREFTEKNKMIWAQYRDRDSKIQRAFNVNSYPTYIVIDHEGIIRFRTSGASWERSAYLEDAIKKAVKVVAKSEQAN